MSGSSTDKLGGRGLSSAPVYVSDLGRCEPAEAISHTSERHRWRAYDYEVRGFGGVMLMAGPETEAPDITYPLEVEGWHAVSIGFYSTIQGLSGVSDFLVRLSGDDTFSVLDPVRADAFEQQGQLEEIYWKTADLTGQQIVFGQLTRRRAPGEGPGVVECGPVRIAYVKLVPLTALGGGGARAGHARWGEQEALRPQRLVQLSERVPAHHRGGDQAADRAVPGHRLLAHLLGSRERRHALLPVEGRAQLGHDRPAEGLRSDERPFARRGVAHPAGGRRRSLPRRRRPRARDRPRGARLLPARRMDLPAAHAELRVRGRDVGEEAGPALPRPGRTLPAAPVVRVPRGAGLRAVGAA